MNKQRAGFDLDDDNDDEIDLSELVGSGNQAPQDKEAIKKVMQKVGTQTGFISRQVQEKKVRVRSPYVIQKNIKMRVGMAELLGELTENVNSSTDQETLEQAILTLIKKHGLKELEKKYKELIKG